MPYYQYCKNHVITPFINLNEKCSISENYENDFTIGKDGILIFKDGVKRIMMELRYQSDVLNFVVLLQAVKKDATAKIHALIQSTAKRFILL